MGIAESKRRNTNILRGWWALTQRASTQGNKMENRKKKLYSIFISSSIYGSIRIFILLILYFLKDY